MSFPQPLPQSVRLRADLFNSRLFGSLPRAEKNGLVAIGLALLLNQVALSILGKSGLVPLLVLAGKYYWDCKREQDKAVAQYQAHMENVKFFASNATYWKDPTITRLEEQMGGPNAVHNACVLSTQNVRKKVRAIAW